LAHESHRRLRAKDMATVTMAPGLPSPQSQSNETLTSLPDTQSPPTSPDTSRRNSHSPHHPELNKEVAALSNKLIHAINHQTDLDDTLNETRHELEASQERVRQLEYAVQEHSSLVASGILVKKADIEADNLRLRVNLAEERKQRVQVENDKQGIEQELESLTTALFEEANQVWQSSHQSLIPLIPSRWFQPPGKMLRKSEKRSRKEMNSCRLSSTMQNFF